MSFDKNNFESSFINTPVIGNSGGPEPAYFQAHSSVRLFFCGWEHCDRTFHDEVDSYHHFINDHIPKRSLHPFRCHFLLSNTIEGDTCNHGFNRRSNFLDHAIVHFSTTLRPYKCSNCDKDFRSRQRLHYHSQRSHPASHSSFKAFRRGSGRRKSSVATNSSISSNSEKSPTCKSSAEFSSIKTSSSQSSCSSSQSLETTSTLSPSKVTLVAAAARDSHENNSNVDNDDDTPPRSADDILLELLFPDLQEG